MSLPLLFLNTAILVKCLICLHVDVTYALTTIIIDNLCCSLAYIRFKYVVCLPVVSIKLDEIKYGSDAAS